MSWLGNILALPKKIAIDWFLKDQLKTLPKALDGYKTTVGILLSIATVIMMGVGSHTTYATTINEGIEYLRLYFTEPLDSAEKKQAMLALQLICTNAMVLWGLVRKALKWANEQPQKPNLVTERVTEKVRVS